jgi:hypothetical protein
MLAEIEPYLEGERTINVVGGFAGWFELPGAPVVKRWKQASIVLLALFPTTLVLTQVREWLLPDRALGARRAVREPPRGGRAHVAPDAAPHPLVRGMAQSVSVAPGEPTRRRADRPRSRVAQLDRGRVEAGARVEVGGDDRAPPRSSVDSQPRIALVGKHRFEKVHANTPPGRSTRETSANTSRDACEVVDRHAARDGIERLVGERQRRVGVEVVDDVLGRRRVGGQLGLVHPERDQSRRWRIEVRDPRRAQVEHVAREPELTVELGDRGDRPVVDVRDEPVERVEASVVGGSARSKKPGGNCTRQRRGPT